MQLDNVINLGHNRSHGSIMYKQTMQLNLQAVKNEPTSLGLDCSRRGAWLTQMEILVPEKLGAACFIHNSSLEL